MTLEPSFLLPILSKGKSIPMKRKKRERKREKEEGNYSSRIIKTNRVGFWP